MKGIARANSERKAVVKAYTTSTLSVKALAAQFNLPESTIYNWIKPIARTRARYRLGNHEAMLQSVNRARIRVYYGSTVSDALTLEDLNRSTYYDYLKLQPFATQADLIMREVATLFQMNLPPEAQKCLTKIRKLVLKEVAPRISLKKPTD